MINFKEYLEYGVINEERFLIAKELYKILYEDINDEKDKEDNKNNEEDDKNKNDKEEKDNKNTNEVEDKTETSDEDEKLTPQAEKEKENETDEKKAEIWYNEYLKQLKSKPGTNTSTENFKRTNTVLLGKIYTFRYDPKHKDKLAFYDENPLVIAFEHKQTSGGAGFLGVNLHFIPKQQRSSVITYFIKKDKVKAMKQGEFTIDYEKDIKNNPRLKYIYYCIRHYLLSQVVGSFIAIPQDEYGMITKLNSAKYVGMTENEIVRIMQNKGVENLLNSPGIQDVKKKKEDANKKRRDALRREREANKIKPVRPVKAPEELNVIKNTGNEKDEKFNGNL